MTEVKIGLQNLGYAEIVSPVLKYPVATIGNHLLTDGTPVQVSELSREQMAKEKVKKGEAARKNAKAEKKAVDKK